MPDIRHRNQKSCIFCRMMRKRCEYPKEVSKCLNCDKHDFNCGPKELMQDSLDRLRSLPPRQPSQQASSQEQNNNLTDNTTSSRYSTGFQPDISREESTVSPALPDAPLDPHDFFAGYEHCFPPNGEGEMPSYPSDWITGMTNFESMDVDPKNAAGDHSEKGIKVTPFSVFEHCQFIPGASVEDQSNITAPSESVPEKYVKDVQNRAYVQMLQEADKVVSPDQARWVSLRVMSALEPMDSADPRMAAGVDTVIKLLHCAGDFELNARVRKLVYKCYPTPRTNDKILELLLHSSLEVQAPGVMSSASQIKKLDEHFPRLHEIVKFGTAAMWEIFHNLDQFPEEARKNHHGQGLEHIAAARGDVDLLKILYAQNPDVDVRDHQDRTPAFIAASEGKKEALEFFYRRGAKLSNRACDGTSFLMAAAASGHVNIIQALKQFGYNFEEKPMGRTSPLIIAAGRGHYEVVRALISFGVDPSYRDSDGKTAEDVARSQGYHLIAELLKLQEQQKKVLELTSYVISQS